MITSTARGYNPNFKAGYDAFKYIVDRYHDELEFAALDGKELFDEDGCPYQVVPVIRVSFK